MITTSAVSQRVQPGRKIEGISALLLPFRSHAKIDFDSFAANLQCTVEAGLVPAVNMDTGYTHLLSRAERLQVLKATSEFLRGKPFVAGAFVEGEGGNPLANYQRATGEIQAAGGVPIIFQCTHMKPLAAAALIQFFQSIASGCQRLLAFELGEVFAPFGQIYPLETIRGLMHIPQIAGLKHSSLSRELEWERLALRDAVRPDFKIYTGNDLAIDMVMYGSDYLLGLSAFAPEVFAARDALWHAADARFYELNDWLQYLGFFAFRPPVPAYKHSAAQFLKLRGRIRADLPHPKSPGRPASDVEALRDISNRLDQLVSALR